MKLGDQVKYLRYDGLRFAVFDKKASVLVLPVEKKSQLAVWISLPSLATILHKRIEELWEKGKPALPILRKIRKTKN